MFSTLILVALFAIAAGFLVAALRSARNERRAARERRAEIRRLEENGDHIPYQLQYPRPSYAETDAKMFGFFAAVAFVFALALMVPAMLIGQSSQIRDLADDDQLAARYDLQVQRRDEQVEIVTAQLIEAYPQLEREIIDSVDDPEILLSYPQIRSSETFRAAVERIVELNDSVYTVSQQIIDNQRQMLGRERSPWVIRPPWFPYYEDNPLS